MTTAFMLTNSAKQISKLVMQSLSLSNFTAAAMHYETTLFESICTNLHCNSQVIRLFMNTP